MMTDEIHRKFVTIKRKSPHSQLCLSVNIRVKKEIGLFTVVKHGRKYCFVARKFKEFGYAPTGLHN